MADHGEIQYATAQGNDLPAHEAGYGQFLKITFIFTAMIVNILFALAIGGVLGHWLPAALILVAAVIAAGISGWTGIRSVSIGMVAISALALLLSAYS
ncbi:MAG TPA: aa3-type cytochrome c oxidase subunit IV [Xanthobacteraceae bacterium]|jgi:integral membrane sensor domain MASE1|nr:aa3-type cytochrome c oxidase subunit IV [Xanthobacteraceae bacterium]